MYNEATSLLYKVNISCFTKCYQIDMELYLQNSHKNYHRHCIPGHTLVYNWITDFVLCKLLLMFIFKILYCTVQCYFFFNFEPLIQSEILAYAHLHNHYTVYHRIVAFLLSEANTFVLMGLSHLLWDLINHGILFARHLDSLGV